MTFTLSNVFVLPSNTVHCRISDWGTEDKKFNTLLVQGSKLTKIKFIMFFHVSFFIRRERYWSEWGLRVRTH